MAKPTKRDFSHLNSPETRAGLERRQGREPGTGKGESWGASFERVGATAPADKKG